MSPAAVQATSFKTASAGASQPVGTLESEIDILGLPACLFRATGITNYLEKGGTLETAAEIAGHASTRTTQLYNRSRERITRDEIERIRI